MGKMSKQEREKAAQDALLAELATQRATAAPTPAPDAEQMAQAGAAIADAAAVKAKAPRAKPAAKPKAVAAPAAPAQPAAKPTPPWGAKDPDKTTPFQLRMPEDLHAELAWYGKYIIPGGRSIQKLYHQAGAELLARLREKYPDAVANWKPEDQ